MPTSSSKYSKVEPVESPPVILAKRTASPERNLKVKNGGGLPPLSITTVDNTSHVPLSSSARLYVNPSGSYTLRMQLSQGFLTAALLVSSASQLKNHVGQKNHTFYSHVFWMIIGSISGQVTAALCLLFSYWARSKLEPVQSLRKRRPRCCVSCADALENVYMVMTFFIMAVNVFIALFVRGGGGVDGVWISTTAAAQKQTGFFNNFTSLANDSLFTDDAEMTTITTTEWNTDMR